MTELGIDISLSALRAHCADIDSPAPGIIPQRSQPRRTSERMKTFTPEEDAVLIEWNAADPAVRGVLHRVAVSMGRKRHSLVARLKSLKRRGAIDKLSL